MLLSSSNKPLIFTDDIVLRSIDWFGDFAWRHENVLKKKADRFEINLVVKDFTPNEISVKTADGYIIVEGKHEEREDDYGYIARQFIRRYLIPEDCNPEEVISTLSPDGILTIITPKKRVFNKNVVIPVQHEAPKIQSKL